MNKQSIYIIDKLVNGYNHVTFNAAITSIIAKVYKNQEVIFICESLHANAIKSKNSNVANLKYQPYNESPLPPNKTKRIFPWIKKKLADLFFINFLYQKRFKQSSAIFFTCLSTSTLFYTSYKTKRLPIPIYFFLHGEIEFIFLKRIGIINKIRGEMYKLFFKQLGETSKIVVISEIVKESLVAGKYLSEDKVIIIEHPITPPSSIRKLSIEKKIIFGHIGIAVKKKNSELFFELSKLHKLEIEKGFVEFQLIGKIGNELFLEDSSTVKILTENNKSLAQDQYEQSIANIDYAIFTFTKDNYVYRASGSVMDAIAFTKPIIALKHHYFDYLFSSAGNIGFLCNNFEELNLLVNRIILKDKGLLSQYQFQQDNLRKLAKRQSNEEIENKLLTVF